MRPLQEKFEDLEDLLLHHRGTLAQNMGVPFVRLVYRPDEEVDCLRRRKGQTLKVWDLERGKIIASFSGDSELQACAATPDGVTIVAGERSGRVHFLRLEGCDRAT